MRTQPHANVARHRFVYPLKLSSSRRYVVDQRNVPFMIVGDSPQALIGNLSVKDAAYYIANRKAAGFNTIWVNLLCAKYTGCRDDGTTLDGIKPFRTPGDLSTPNPAYFARADAIIRLAAKAGIVVLLDPIETGGWLNVLRKNGLAKDRAYGRFLGRRYKSFGNIVWMSGNDFQTWSKAEDDAVVLAVATGHSVRRSRPPPDGRARLLDSGSRDDPRWGSLIKLSAAYTYYPTYGTRSARAQSQAASAGLHGRSWLRVRAEQLVDLEGRPGEPYGGRSTGGLRVEPPVSSMATTTPGNSPKVGRITSILGAVCKSDTS